VSDDASAALLSRLIDAINTQVAETRALRVLFQTFARRVLSTSSRPREIFESLRADALATFQYDVDQATAGSPDEYRAATAARFHGESLLAELEALLLPGDDPAPEKPN
jgi:hypothetical protein